MPAKGLLTQLEVDKIRQWLFGDIDLKMHRIQNAGQSVNSGDYVTRGELLATLTKPVITIYSGTLSPDTRPSNPAVGDLFLSTDFNHTYRCTSIGPTVWVYADEGRGHVEWCIEAKGTGWHICDGSTNIRFSKSDGTTELKTVPNLNNGTFPRFNNSYSGPTPTAAVAPTGSIGNTTATNIANTTGITVNSNTTGITVSDHASHTHDDASSLSTPDLFAPDTTATGVAGRTGNESATLTHTVNDSGHNHAITDSGHNHTQNAHNHSLTMNADGLPKYEDGIPYIRL